MMYALLVGDDPKPRRRRARPSAGDQEPASPEDVFTVREAARVAEIPARSINFWTGFARVLKPDHAYRGRGSAKRFSLRNLVQLRVISRLAERGISLESMRALMAKAEHERSFGEDWFALPAAGPQGPLGSSKEFLTCAQPGEWRRWLFLPEDHKGRRHGSKKAAATRPLVVPVPWRPGAKAVTPWAARDEQPAFLLELLGGEDVVVVNLGRIKAELLGRFAKGRPEKS